MSTSRVPVSGPDLRIIALNRAMCLLETLASTRYQGVILAALDDLQNVKASLINHLDHDRLRPISYPPFKTLEVSQQPPVKLPSEQ